MAPIVHCPYWQGLVGVGFQQPLKGSRWCIIRDSVSSLFFCTESFIITSYSHPPSILFQICLATAAIICSLLKFQSVCYILIKHSSLVPGLPYVTKWISTVWKVVAKISALPEHCGVHLLIVLQRQRPFSLGLIVTRTQLGTYPAQMH